MLMLFRGQWIDPVKVTRITVSEPIWQKRENDNIGRASIWIHFSRDLWIKLPSKKTYKLSECKHVNWSEICADELSEIAQEINSLLKVAKCKN